MRGRLVERNHLSDGFANGVLRMFGSEIQDKLIKSAICVAHPTCDRCPLGTVHDFNCGPVQTVDSAHYQFSQVWTSHRYFGPWQCSDPSNQLVNIVNVGDQLHIHPIEVGLTSPLPKFGSFLQLLTCTSNVGLLPRGLSLREKLASSFIRLESWIKAGDQFNNVQLQATDTGGGRGDRNQRIRVGFRFSFVFRFCLVCTLRLVNLHCASVGLSSLPCANEIAPHDGNDRADSLNPIGELAGCARAKFELENWRQESSRSEERQGENDCCEEHYDNDEGFAQEVFHGDIVSFRDRRSYSVRAVYL